MIVGIGIDLVEIDRMRLLLQRKGDRALERMFTARERTYAHTHPEPERQLAARAAAKEATYKALSGNDLARAIGWREMEVVSVKGQAPVLVLHGRAQTRANELGVYRVHLSISHTEHMAVAYVIAERA
ncbi:MAG: holo-(acyl-carrier-protein) synthase [Gemmatimonadetes bacterium]|jgi:holo-[acyl-carrier protein] synthase|nr:holo-(acyl-carrier-protein) synthase [Gemmatimonadota bacterium]